MVDPQALSDLVHGHKAAPDPVAPAKPEGQADAAPGKRDGPVTRLTAEHDNALMELTVDGRKRMMPVAEARAELQKRGAGNNRLAEANALKDQYKEQLARDTQLQRLLQENPEAAVRLIEQEAGKRGYKRPEPQTKRQDDDYDDGSDRRTPDAATASALSAVEAKYARLEGALAELQQERQVTHSRRAIDQALDGYEMFQGKTDAHKRLRTLATNFAAAASATGATSDLGEAVGMIHDELAEVLKQKSYEELSTRRNRSDELANVPAGQGAPSLTAPLPPIITQAGAKRGELREALKDLFAQMKDSTNVSAR